MLLLQLRQRINPLRAFREERLEQKRRRPAILIGIAVNWTKSQTLAEVSEWNFDLSGSGPALTWENGTNDFSGDTLNLTFGGAYTGGVVFSGSGATLTGWESVGAVNIGGSAAVRDGSVWRVAGAWELSRNADNQLILSKLA